MGNRNDKPAVGGAEVPCDTGRGSETHGSSAGQLGESDGDHQTTEEDQPRRRRRSRIKSVRRMSRKNRRKESEDLQQQQQQQQQQQHEEEQEEAELQEKSLSYWGMIKGGYNELVNAIIRPPRAEYDVHVLGPTTFSVNGRLFVREDIQLVNKRGLKLMCSHWRPRDYGAEEVMPCMVYLHGNASCRAEALENLPLLLSSGLSLFAFDFAGSGMSEGQYISLGWYERDDVETVVTHLRQDGHVSTIGLWGRSMGAVTALMFGNRDPTIACMVLDSPFASLKQLAKELVDNAQLSVPKFALGIALKMVRSSVKSRAGFDINKLNPIENADQIFIPALFGAAESDIFIRPHHSQQIHDKYAGDKNIITFPGDHNTPRPRFFSSSVGIFLHNTMVLPCHQQTESNDVHIPPDVEQDPEIYSNFHNAYSMPAPMSPTTYNEPTSRGDMDSEVFESEYYYEEELLRHAIELSLAEAVEQQEIDDEQEQEQIEEQEEEQQAEQKEQQQLPVPAPADPPMGPPTMTIVEQQQEEQELLPGHKLENNDTQSE